MRSSCFSKEHERSTLSHLLTALSSIASAWRFLQPRAQRCAFTTSLNRERQAKMPFPLTPEEHTLVHFADSLVTYAGAYFYNTEGCCPSGDTGVEDFVQLACQRRMLRLHPAVTEFALESESLHVTHLRSGSTARCRRDRHPNPVSGGAMATKAMAGAGAGAQLGARRQRVSAKSARSARSSRELAMRSKAEGSGSGQGSEPDNPPTFDENWLQASPVVFGASFLGWIIPASIPTPAFNGDSLVSVRSLASLLSFSSLSRWLPMPSLICAPTFAGVQQSDRQGSHPVSQPTPSHR